MALAMKILNPDLSTRTIRVSAETHLRLRVLAAKNDLTIGEAVAQLAEKTQTESAPAG